MRRSVKFLSAILLSVLLLSMMPPVYAQTTVEGGLSWDWIVDWDNWKVEFPEVSFTSDTILFESNPTTGWNPANSYGDQLEFAFYVDEEITISDLFIETKFTGKDPEKFAYDFNDDGLPDNLMPTPTNIRIEICKYSNSMTLESLKSVKAGVYSCNDDSMFNYNSFTQLTGGKVDLTLKRGVYYAHITPQSVTPALLGTNHKVIYLGDFGVVATGTSKGALLLFSPDLIPALYPLISDVNAGKSLSEIDKSYAAEIDRVKEEKRKAEEAAKKAADEKAAKEAAAQKAKPISLKVNGTVIKTDSAPVTENGRTLAPLRAVVEALGYIVAWEQSTQIIQIYDPDTQDLLIQMKVGSNKAKVSTGIYGVMTDVIMDVPAKTINGRTMVPVRFIAESLGCQVSWDEKTKTVIIVQAVG